jgi:RNA polymerase primary sigma factor
MQLRQAIARSIADHACPICIPVHMTEMTTWVWSSLMPCEEWVLRIGVEITMDTDHTQEEVRKHFSVTQERIRQIEAKALRRLKYPSESRELFSFFDP